MTDNTTIALIIAAALVVAGFASGGRYTVSGSGQGGALIVDRYTGSAWSCVLSQCYPARFQSN